MKKPLAEELSEQLDEAANIVVWKEIARNPVYEKVAMPKNWKSVYSDEDVAEMEAEGSVREFWKYENGDIKECWLVND